MGKEGMEVEGVRDERWRREGKRDGWEKRWRSEGKGGGRSRSEGMEVEGVREERWRREGKRDGWEKRWRSEGKGERVEVRGEGWGHHCTPM